MGGSSRTCLRRQSRGVGVRGGLREGEREGSRVSTEKKRALCFIHHFVYLGRSKSIRQRNASMLRDGLKRAESLMG